MNKFIVMLFLSFTFIVAAQNTTNDTDNDLVPNNVDKCPNTPESVFVTKDGCTKSLHRIIYFEFNSAVINEDFQKTIVATSELINETPGYKILIKGHTDSTADARTNMILSKKRATAVANMLMKNNVIKDKLNISWYGETKPVASNIKEEGRKQNRRVNIILK